LEAQQNVATEIRSGGSHCGENEVVHATIDSGWCTATAARNGANACLPFRVPRFIVYHTIHAKHDFHPMGILVLQMA
jgi:hypothetical protein